MSAKKSVSKLYSMTGFAQCSKTVSLGLEGAYSLQLRAKSLNHRFLEVKVKSPRWDFLNYDISVRKLLPTYFQRGAFDISLSIEKTADVASTHKYFDQNKLTQIIAEIDAIKKLAPIEKTAWLEKTVPLAELLRLPGVGSPNSSEESSTPIQSKENQDILIKTCDELSHVALTQLQNEREKEGANLKAHLMSLLTQINGHFTAILKLEPMEREKSIQLFDERARKTADFLVRHLGDMSSELAGDSVHSTSKFFDQRLREEAVFWIERRDIEEEKVRLNSHLTQVSQILNDTSQLKDQSLGKYLDFKQQELSREINTLGNKVQSIEVSSHVVMIKTLLEKMKEQVANVE